MKITIEELDMVKRKQTYKVMQKKKIPGWILGKIRMCDICKTPLEHDKQVLACQLQNLDVVFIHPDCAKKPREVRLKQ